MLATHQVCLALGRDARTSLDRMHTYAHTRVCAAYAAVRGLGGSRVDPQAPRARWTTLDDDRDGAPDDLGMVASEALASNVLEGVRCRHRASWDTGVTTRPR